MDNITYFRLNSPYLGDVTKNCALTGAEVDNNFYTLEGRDIKSVEFVDRQIKITLLNGKVFTSEVIEDNGVKDLSISFNSETGVLTIEQDGVTSEFGGIITTTNITYPETQVFIDTDVRTDGSLKGKGTAKNPTGISPVHKTGQYKPVQRIIKVNEGEELPNTNVYVGDRYLTVEDISDCGFLYNYDGLKRLACKLQEAESPWRVPSKADWDDMLNAIEPNEGAKNHTDARSNKWLGEYAGKILKSRDMWKTDEDSASNCECNHSTTGVPDNTLCQEDCNTIFVGFENPCQCACCSQPNANGIDFYGFGVKPCGYANEAKDFMYYKERAYFWTSTNHEYRDAYIKAFSYKKSTVLQDILAADNYLSVRLVKDYDGQNFNEHEDILDGTYPTVMMPSVEHGHAIWTAVNVSVSNCCCTNRNLLPNDGEGIDATTHYYINEWNGKEWLRKEVLDGESVVVINHNPNQDDSPLNLDYTEYRVTKDGLVDVARMVYENVVETFTSDITRIDLAIDELNDKVDAEIERATNAEQGLQEQITANTEAITEANSRIDETNNALDEEIAAREAADTALSERIENVSGGLEEEIAAREAADTALGERIDATNQALEEEIAARENADNELNAAITLLDEKIADEAEIREAADEELNDKMLTEEGTVFDPETGVLTLKSNGGTNDIDVQFSFNFGTF